MEINLSFRPPQCRDHWKITQVYLFIYLTVPAQQRVEPLLLLLQPHLTFYFLLQEKPNCAKRYSET